MPSGLEIQKSLREFVDRWRAYRGSERSEAQTFLNELCECYGTNRFTAGAKFEDAQASVGIMDLYWPGSCIVEMKAPGRAAKLAEHRTQALDYWRESSDVGSGVEAPQYVVLCAFHRFEVWMPGRYPTRPVADFTLDELPDRYDALMFLAGVGLQASFLDHHRSLTTQATQVVSDLYHGLADRGAAPVDELHRFVLQTVWCLFAEDLGMLDGYPLQTIVAGLRKDPTRSSYAELGSLYEVLNQKGNQNRRGALAGTRYVNGDLFARPAKLHLEPAELDLVGRAAEYDWRKVNPTIFGSLLEGVLGERRRELGAHYTHEVDILKIVEPTISRPWAARIAATTSPAQGRELLDELCSFRVLDPACGCGNFLYVAYRELRSLERDLKERIATLAAERGGGATPAGPLPYVRLANMQGMDIERVAVLIARVTLWMGHRQMIELYGEAEPALPLVDLSGVQVGDALRLPWPQTDAIVGNPPFLGSQLVRSAMGDDYVDWLKRTFEVGVKDYCVYWFRRAHAHLRPGQRAGLVGTNSIAQNRARSASLDHLTGSGGVITDAVSSQRWPGEAKVHVALVNWVKQPAVAPVAFRLDGVAVTGITSSLTAGGQVPDPVVLAANRGRCFQGPIPVGVGFLLNEETARWLRGRSDAAYLDVVRPYLIGEDMTDRPDQGPARWIIDFASMPLEEAMRYPAALAIVRKLVKPERDDNARRARRERWWQFGEKAVGMRAALRDLPRYAAAGATGKRLVIGWQDKAVCPSNLVYVFAFDDDYSMGVLMSRAHSAWARARDSTLETRLRYTPTSGFMTFPWPQPSGVAQREVVAAACVALLARRSQICRDRDVGLTTLYNAVDDGAHRDLATLHRRLDEAVVVCYGWPGASAQDDAELVRRLTDLNAAIATGAEAYDPFAVTSGA